MPRERKTPRVTRDQVRNLLTLPIYDDREPSLAAVLNIGRASAYSLAASGTVPTIRVGSRVLVPVGPLLQWLGEEPGLTAHQDRQAADLREHDTSVRGAPGALTGRSP